MKNKELKKVDAERNNCFLQGYICAVVVLINLNGEVDTRTRELYRDGVGNLTLSALNKRGIDEYDLSVLEKYWTQLH